MNPLDLLPASWRSELVGARIQPVRTGAGGAFVFRVERPGERRFLKIAAGQQAEDLREEMARTAWLGAQGIRVPAILRSVTRPELAAVLMGALEGELVEEAGHAPADLVAAVGRGLARLHALPADACPFDESLRVRLARAEADVAAGRIDPGEFEERNAGLSPEAIYARLVATAPASEDVVVVHGDATFTNLFVDCAGALGFVDCGRAGRADRYVDLALVAAEVENRFGGRWLESFFRTYGIDPASADPGKLRFYADLYELF